MLPKVMAKRKRGARPVPDLENARNRYAVTGDRQRFLINTLLAEPSDEPINVLVNWASGRN